MNARDGAPGDPVTLRGAAHDGAARTDAITALTAATNKRPGPPELEDAYDELVGELRLLLDAMAGAAIDSDVARSLQTQLNGVRTTLGERQVGERERVWGRWHARPGRGQALVPPVSAQEVTADSSTGTVRFGRFHVGENLAVHGGAVAALFDEALGWLCMRLGLPPSRTAYLHVDYHEVTPVGSELSMHAWIDRIEGRKYYLRGELRDTKNILCAKADGLFVQLRPGQP